MSYSLISFYIVVSLILFFPLILHADEKMKIGKKPKFYGDCDASAAISIGKDMILVASDEFDKVYFYSEDGQMFLAEKRLNSLLGFEETAELDLEGAVKVDDKIWWIGSHSLNKHAEREETRQVFFATNVPSQQNMELSLSEKQVDLLPLIQSAKIFKDEAFSTAPKKGGINIEGLTAHHDGGFLVAFRSPLNGDDGLTGNATLLHIVKEGQEFKIKKTHQLDLKNRGIRDIVHFGSKYLILAGPVQKTKHFDQDDKFDAYIWNGKKKLKRLDDDGVLNKRNPEAVVKISDKKWLILSDDGSKSRKDFTVNDAKRDCKDIKKDNPHDERHPKVFFRALKVKIE